MRSESEWLFLGARDYFQPRTVDVIADAGVSYLNAIHVISGSLRAGKPWVVVKESPLFSALVTQSMTRWHSTALACAQTSNQRI